MRDVPDGFDFSTSDLIFSFSSGVKFDLSRTVIVGGVVNLILSAKRPCWIPKFASDRLVSLTLPLGSTALICRVHLCPGSYVKSSLTLPIVSLVVWSWFTMLSILGTAPLPYVLVVSLKKFVNSLAPWLKVTFFNFPLLSVALNSTLMLSPA